MSNKPMGKIMNKTDYFWQDPLLDGISTKLDQRLSAIEYAYNEWQDKTEWVQNTAQPEELGMHRADVLRKRIENLKYACSRLNDDVSQILGKVLKYPKFVDDQKNFPVATEKDGVCVGDHVAETLALEAAEKIKNLELERKEILRVLRRLYDVAYEARDYTGMKNHSPSMYVDLSHILEYTENYILCNVKE